MMTYGTVVHLTSFLLVSGKSNVATGLTDTSVILGRLWLDSVDGGCESLGRFLM